MCLVRNVIVFFYCYVYEAYYYENNGTVWSSHFVLHPEGELMPLPEWSTRGNTVGLLRLKIMRIQEKCKGI